VRFTPFAGEDIGWLHATAGRELFMFASDYPHHEGTDDPIGRFDRTMASVTGDDQRGFYETILRDLVGPSGT